MKTNVKPGDLARIIYPGFATPLADRIVFVEREAKEGDVFTDIMGGTTTMKKTGDSPAWVVSAKNPLEWATDAGDIKLYMQRALSDKFLRRIGGDDLLVDETETEKPFEKVE
jgi:hypothetical protein